MKFKRSLFLYCVAIAMAVTWIGEVQAQVVSDDGTISIEEAWVRETPIGGNSGGGYMRIRNTSAAPDRLVSATSAVAKSIELRQMTYVGETLQTRGVTGGIEIKPGEMIQFRWEDYHLLFVDLKKPFAREQQFEASLKFEKAGVVKVRFEVRPRVYW